MKKLLTLFSIFITFNLCASTAKIVERLSLDYDLYLAIDFYSSYGGLEKSIVKIDRNFNKIVLFNDESNFQLENSRIELNKLSVLKGQSSLRFKTRCLNLFKFLDYYNSQRSFDDTTRNGFSEELKIYVLGNNKIPILVGRYTVNDLFFEYLETADNKQVQDFKKYAWNAHFFFYIFEKEEGDRGSEK